MSVPVHRYLTGRTAVKLAEEIESAIRDRSLAPGDRLPPVRELAMTLSISPATVASAYRLLQARALLVSQGRRGTRVGHRPAAPARSSRSSSQSGHGAVALARGGVNLADGNPDRTLLPDCAGALHTLNYSAQLYGGAPVHPELIATMRLEMDEEGVRSGPCCVVNGAMDGIDRLLAEHLRAGDRVAVEDPGFPGHHDLVASRGLALEPVRVDGEGILPDALAHACSARVKAILITPRAQSPTGAALTPERARDLRRVLRSHPDVLIIEDDHASFLTPSTPFQRLHDSRGRWAHLRSFSKAFNPDLRLAVMTGDEQTMTRVMDRLAIAERWVSMLLQSLAYALLCDAGARRQVARAGLTYQERREALVNAITGAMPGAPSSALPEFATEIEARSGYNVWIPVDEETPTVQSLATAGWAVAAGERFRLGAAPAIRVTAARLDPAAARRFARDLASALRGPQRDRSEVRRAGV